MNGHEGCFYCGAIDVAHHISCPNREVKYKGKRYIVRLNGETGYIVDLPEGGDLRTTPFVDELRLLATGDTLSLTRTDISDEEVEQLEEFRGW